MLKKKTLWRYVSCNLVAISHIRCFGCILAVWYLTMWNTIKIYVFGNVVLFLHIESYYRVFSFRYLRTSKTFIIYVSRNVFSFPYIEYFAWILAFSAYQAEKHSKYLFIYLFFFCLVIKGCLACALAFRYVRSSKTLKRHVFRNDVFIAI